MGKVKRWHNFNAGPSVLPEEVLEKTREDLYSYRGTGIGVLEMSHRGAFFESLVDEAESKLRRIAEVPDTHGILFCTGGATTQFSMLATAFLGSGVGNYYISGYWSERAMQEGSKFGETHVAASTKSSGYVSVNAPIQLSENAAYLHFTSNNTAEGTQFPTEPNCGDVPLFCDACSDILSRRVDFSKYGLLYAGAQKNLGCAGVTIAIVRKSLLESAPKALPVMQDYRTYLNNKSLFNTPPAFAIYILNEMLNWIEGKGGLAAIEANNRKKAQTLYDALDSNPRLLPCAEKASRSLMNITFRFSSPEEEKRFLKEAEQREMYGIQGHKAFGGVRVSVYNAAPLDSVAAMAELMRTF